MYFHVNLNFPILIKVNLLVSEQYRDSILHGATIKDMASCLSTEYVKIYKERVSESRTSRPGGWMTVQRFILA